MVAVLLLRRRANRNFVHMYPFATKRALLAPAELTRTIVFEHLKRAKKPKFHASVSAVPIRPYQPTVPGNNPPFRRPG